MRMRWIIICGLLAPAWQSCQAQSGQAILESPARMFAQAEAVYCGVVTRAADLPAAGREAEPPIATIRVLQAWKGEVHYRERIAADESFGPEGIDARAFVLGQCYLIHARRDERRPQLLRCVHARPLSGAQRELAFLEAIGESLAAPAAQSLCDSVLLTSLEGWAQMDPERRAHLARGCGGRPDLIDRSLPLLRDLRRSPHEGERAAAVEALIRLADARPELLPMAVGALADESPAVFLAAQELESRAWQPRDTLAVGALAALLADPREEARCAAARILGAMGGLARGARPAFALALGTAPVGQGDADRDCVAEAARRIDEHLALVRAAEEKSRSADPRVRSEGFRFLIESASSAGLPVEALVPAFTDSAPHVRAVSIQAASSGGEWDPAARAAFADVARRLLDDASGRVRAAAARTLAALAPEIAIDACIRPACVDPSPLTRLHAITLLSGMRPVPTEAATLMAGLIEDEDDDVRLAAIQGLAKLETCDAEAAAALDRRMRASHASESLAAADALGRLSARTAVTAAIIRQMPADGPHMRAAREGLRFSPAVIRPDREISAAALPLLRAELSDPDLHRRVRAAECLGFVWSRPPEAVQLLRRCTGDRSDAVRRTAAASLADLAGLTDSAADALLPLLDDRDAGVRREAAAGLGWLGPRAAAAVPALERLRETDADAAVVRQAGAAVRRIQGR